MWATRFRILKQATFLFFGPNLPHLYRNHSVYYEARSSLNAKSIVIHFREASIGHDFLSLPQAKKIKKLFQRSQKGIDFSGATSRKVGAQMQELLKAKGMKRLLLLLEILNTLAETKDYHLISDAGMVGQNDLDTERLSCVFDYILHHFHEEIRLVDVAKLVHMTPTSFCRFF